MTFRDTVNDELAALKIKAEYVEVQDYPSYSIHKLKIISSARISRNRLDRLESNIEEKAGFLPQVSKYDDVLEISEMSPIPSVIMAEAIKEKLSKTGF